MENQGNGKSAFTVTGVFADKADAENAYHFLMTLGYTPSEVTLIMSDETGQKMNKNNDRHHRAGSRTRFIIQKELNGISEAIDAYGKFVAIPGVSLIVAGDLAGSGLNALANSVMSDKYATYYKTLIKDGEIVIDFAPHSVKEKNMIAGLWEDFHGYPITRRANHAA
jgi:hypothetical protein